MTNDASRTWDALLELGFEVDRKEISDGMPALAYSFGSWKLSATWGRNRWFQETVWLYGVEKTARTLKEVSFEMPTEVSAREQCAAWISWHLDSIFDGFFIPDREVTWLAKGRENQSLLPWVAEREAYERRPRCLVGRDWLRLAIKTLKGVGPTGDDSPIVVSFDGRILRVEYAGAVVVLPATGDPWQLVFRIAGKYMGNLPKRIMSDPVAVSVWEGRLAIGRQTFPVESFPAS